MDAGAVPPPQQELTVRPLPGKIRQKPGDQVLCWHRGRAHRQQVALPFRQIALQHPAAVYDLPCRGVDPFSRLSQRHSAPGGAVKQKHAQRFLQTA